MSFRTLLLIVLLVPALLLGGAAATGLRVPVPAMGRDYVLHFPLGPGDMPVDLPSISGPKDPSLPLVVIDAGHGGRDPGAIGSDAQGRKVQEKDITLALALALTREDDRILPLPHRPEVARLLDADLFVSIHADSAGEQDNVSGASIYTLSNDASSEAAARFAARENDADRLNGIAIEGRVRR